MSYLVQQHQVSHQLAHSVVAQCTHNKQSNWHLRSHFVPQHRYLHLLKLHFPEQLHRRQQLHLHAGNRRTYSTIVKNVTALQFFTPVVPN